MLTQIAACLQTQLYDMGEKGRTFIIGSCLIIYCVVLFTLTTKWAVQAPFAFFASQVCLYLANGIGSDTKTSDVMGVVVLNTFLPLLMFCLSFSLLKTKLSLYISKMSEVMGQIEMKNILKMIPQALFFIDETYEEILHQSDALVSLLGQDIKDVLSYRIFEDKDSLVGKMKYNSRPLAPILPDASMMQSFTSRKLDGEKSPLTSMIKKE